ncbi:hypothetical protein DRH29_01350 [candidate division Kazan bacterium]|uniref:Uncharacterized protein n=1 Tax=candidate division Kazan bacterium TaxID=2202143 RepID=A0A420ZDL6_UNCK3|nr:MAG: hypothetical protein DRH29_01350 [candidate division Kazan bacterium]
MAEETSVQEVVMCDFHKRVLPGRLVDVPVGSKRFGFHGVEETSLALRFLCYQCADRVERKDMFLSTDLVTYLDGSGEPIRPSREMLV